MLVDQTRTETRPASAKVRSEAEIDAIRRSLQDRYDELDAEHQRMANDSRQLGQVYVGDDPSGDDADIGAKTSERERELSVLRSILERREQVAAALRRLAAGSYGWCERCSDPIPVERLTVFPWVTTCVSCKQLAERRAN